MKRTVAKVDYKGNYRVVFDDEAKANPYTIYKEYYADGPSGFGKHRQKIAGYEDMLSCMYHIAQEYSLYGIN